MSPFLARNQSLANRIGCIFNLYCSVENIDEEHFHSEPCKALLLSPSNGAEIFFKALKLKIYDCVSTKCFRCND
ncbi:hypothetical protein L484_022089 [Morus notabilis]|uniref:Uncharacterized protein n=1 Tax=Morus notabilis TaxID=981085 RepID=W9SDX9_9ROSA|nr:hypothetical protein L484_022089 [Morus notabilis]